MSELNLDVSELVPAARSKQFTDQYGVLVDSLKLSDHSYVHIVRNQDGQPIVVPATQTSAFHRAAIGEGVGIDAYNLDSPKGNFFWTMHTSSKTNSEKALSIDQTNETVVLDNQISLKWQLVATESLAAKKERILFQNNFLETPQLLGHFWWHDSDGVDRLIASASRFIESSQDGWEWLPKFFNTSESFAWAAQLGQVTARMHEHFRTAQSGLIKLADIAQMQERTKNFLRGFTNSDSAQASLLSSKENWVLSELAELEGFSQHLIHGDYHVGQILRTNDDDIYIIDFDGDPLAQTQTEMQSPLIDLASMRCSFLHAAAVVIKQGAKESLIIEKAKAADAAFISGYQEAQLLTDRDIDMIHPLMWNHEIRELAYAEQFLPRWRYAAEFGITQLQDGYGR